MEGRERSGIRFPMPREFPGDDDRVDDVKKQRNRSVGRDEKTGRRKYRAREVRS
jgi:hypothetical protein